MELLLLSGLARVSPADVGRCGQGRRWRPALGRRMLAPMDDQRVTSMGAV